MFSYSTRLLLMFTAAAILAATGKAATAATPGTIGTEMTGAPGDGPVALSRTIHVGEAAIQIDFGPGDFDMPPESVIAWIDAAARSVSSYYGRFPVRSARVLVLPVAGARGVRQGTTWGGVRGFPAFTRMRIGQHTRPEDLKQDWTMTHEFVHAAFPSVAEDHHWIEEGTATYVEPIARVEVGELDADGVWRDMIRDMPKGQPEPGDQGLDRTHTWARTYWGGAGFCLLADVTIRQRTRNRKGLRDALRGVVAAGGTIDQEWPLTRALETGDAATGTHVLMELYTKMRDTAVPIDFPALWKQLGVESKDGAVHYDSKAPLADARKSILSAETKLP